MAQNLANWRGPENGDCTIEDIIYKNSARDIDRPEEIKKCTEMLIPSTCYITLRT